MAKILGRGKVVVEPTLHIVGGIRGSAIIVVKLWRGLGYVIADAARKIVDPVESTPNAKQAVRRVLDAVRADNREEIFLSIKLFFRSPCQEQGRGDPFYFDRLLNF